MTGFVYFMRCGEFIKIGWSKYPENRRRALSTMIPFDVEMIGCHPGSEINERLLHRRFAADRQRGEWFAATPEILAMARDGFQYVPNEPNDLTNAINERGIMLSAVARKMGLERQTVSAWFRPGGRVPGERVVEVEEATGIARHELRPDLHLPPAGTGDQAA